MMMDVFIREIECSNCGTLTRHRVSTLDEIIPRQSRSIGDEKHINYACPECNTLALSRVVRGAKIIRDMDLSKFPDDLRIFVVSLECDQKGCESPVILLAGVKAEILEAPPLIHMQTKWHNRSAVCESGNSPAFPLSIREVVKLP